MLLSILVMLLLGLLTVVELVKDCVARSRYQYRVVLRWRVFIVGLLVIAVVSISLSTSSYFVCSYAAINVRLRSSYFCQSNIEGVIFVTVSAGNDTVTL